MKFNNAAYPAALDDFHQARRKAKLQSLIAGVSGKRQELLSYKEIVEKVDLLGVKKHSIKEIPLESIKGSVGRYQDFNQNFLPLIGSSAQRWAKIKVAMEQEGLPPIEVYQLGSIYFVIDGNHRVSVAREMGLAVIEAYVTEIHVNIAIDQVRDIPSLVLQSERATLFEKTGLDQYADKSDFRVSEIGAYKQLFEHIHVHQFYLGLETQQDVSIHQAAASWVRNVYLPVHESIQQLGILRDFPNRTVTDLYLWVKKHQAELTDALNWNIGIDQAAHDLSEKSNRKGLFNLSKLWNSLIGGRQRKTHKMKNRSATQSPSSGRLCDAILVCLTGMENNWEFLDQAILVAQRENAVLRGLHVVPQEKDEQSPRSVAIAERFQTRCREKNVPAEFAVAHGIIAENILERATWVDLVMMQFIHTPSAQPNQRLQSGIGTIIQNSPRPIFLVPALSTNFNRALLAYDSSVKAKEALYLSSYINKSWGTHLWVVSVEEGLQNQEESSVQAKKYLTDHGVEATIIQTKGMAGDAILQTAEEYRIDWILMGGYGHSKIMNKVIGSTVDQVLQEFSGAVLICP